VLDRTRFVRGDGRIPGSLLIRGLVAPGTSAGILTVDDVTWDGDSRLEVELGGRTRGTEYDALVSTGSVALLGGTLNAVLINSFVPRCGDAFDVMDFAGLTGTFVALNLPALGPDLWWDTSRLYASGVLEVVPEPAPVPRK